MARKLIHPMWSLVSELLQRMNRLEPAATVPVSPLKHPEPCYQLSQPLRFPQVLLLFWAWRVREAQGLAENGRASKLNWPLFTPVLHNPRLSPATYTYRPSSVPAAQRHGINIS